MKVPLFHWLTPCGIPPLWQTTDALHEPVPTLTPSKHQVGNSLIGVNYKPLPFASHIRPIGGCFVESFGIFCQIFQTRRVILLQICWIVMANMFIYTNKFDRISSRKGNNRNFIISTSVCGCAECACWLALVMRHCQFIFRYVTLQQPQMGMI